MTETHGLLTDPRIRSVQWRDLTKLSRTEIIAQLTISLPWLALSLFLAGRGLHVPAAGASFIFFLLKHHARCLEDDDVEARSAHMSALGALCWGPIFPVQLHTEALRAAGVRQRR